jgi:hypothetical protein
VSNGPPASHWPGGGFGPPSAVSGSNGLAKFACRLATLLYSFVFKHRTFQRFYTLDALSAAVAAAAAAGGGTAGAAAGAGSGGCGGGLGLTGACAGAGGAQGSGGGSFRQGGGAGAPSSSSSSSSSSVSLSSLAHTQAPPTSILGDWVRQLDYFLSFVPTPTPATEVLFDLRRGLERRADLRADVRD